MMAHPGMTSPCPAATTGEHYVITESDGARVCQICGQPADRGHRQPDALSRALMAAQPALAGHVHYVDGRPWCDGVNHTTRCSP